MGLPHGCLKKADELFAKRYKTDQIYIHNNNVTNCVMRIPNLSCHMDISYMRGDCTAATVYLECLGLEDVPTMFKALQEYMSINARISCIFSLKKHKKILKEWIAALRQFPIAGLHLQKSNREPDSEYYMITGILKVPNPVINTYDQYNQEYPDNHNNNDVTNINALNAEFGLQTF